MTQPEDIVGMVLRGELRGAAVKAIDWKELTYTSANVTSTAVRKALAIGDELRAVEAALLGKGKERVPQEDVLAMKAQLDALQVRLADAIAPMAHYYAALSLVVAALQDKQAKEQAAEPSGAGPLYANVPPRTRRPRRRQ